MRLQKRVSAKDGQAVELPASLPPGPHMGSVGNTKNMTKSSPSEAVFPHLGPALKCEDEVESVSPTLSVEMASLKSVYSSAVEGHCEFNIKAKKNQISPERTSCLL